MSSNAKGGMNKRKASHILVEYFGPSYSDLPKDVVEIIVLRLSIERIFVCKGVCKTWYNIISDPEFKKLHFDQADRVYPLIQTSGFTLLSRMLYLVQPKEDDFELKLDCNHTSPECKLGCVCYVKVKLDTKFRLPLRNLEMIVNEKNDGKFNSKYEAGRNNGLKLNMKHHKYKIVNSCNGLLCLSDPSNNNPMIVCNPVTGEFVNLPEERTSTSCVLDDIVSGFGFSPVTNQYKVIRMFKHSLGIGDSVMLVETHTLGTKSWKHLGYLPYATRGFTLPTYVSGYLYWNYLFKPSVIFFDMEKDCFGWFSPVLSGDSFQRGLLTVGVLGGELCLSESFKNDRIDFWVMRDCDGKRDWFKMLSIKMNGKRRWPLGRYEPIKYLNNGALLMYNSSAHGFVCHDPKKRGYRYLKVHGMKSKVEVISHIPSFVSLKDVLSGLNMKVFNVKSRCAELKLHKEDQEISIVSDKRNFMSANWNTF